MNTNTATTKDEIPPEWWWRNCPLFSLDVVHRTVATNLRRPPRSCATKEASESEGLRVRLKKGVYRN